VYAGKGDGLRRGRRKNEIERKKNVEMYHWKLD